jgi:hypothetical protein
MTDLLINYSLTNFEIFTFPLASAYGLRHLEKEGWLNKVIGVIELFPVLGPIVALIERLVVSVFQKSPVNQSSLSSSALKEVSPLVWIREFKSRATRFALEKNIVPRPVCEISLTPENEMLVKTVINGLNQTGRAPNVTIHSQSGVWVFSIKEIPDLIFKCAKEGVDLNENELLNRIHNTDQAKQIIDNDKLYLLCTPQQKIFEFDLENGKQEVLIEQKFDILQDFDAQRNLFQFCVEDPDLNPFIQECARQLIVLIVKTGYSDVRYDNNPILSNGEGLCLIDMDTSPSPITGLSTGKARQRNDGILRYLSFDILKALEPDLKQLLTEAQFEELNFSQILIEKKNAIERNQKFAEYLKEKNILTGKEPVKLQGWTLINTDKSKFSIRLQETINELALRNLGLCPIEERKFCISMRLNDDATESLNQLKQEKKIFDWMSAPSGFYLWV